MKVKRFDGRWDNEELDAFLLRDGVSIIIKFITESDYQIRIYYEEITSYSASVQSDTLLSHPTDYSQESMIYANPPFYVNYQQPIQEYSNQPQQTPISTSSPNFALQQQLRVDNAESPTSIFVRQPPYIFWGRMMHSSDHEGESTE